jgi:hypothetical protein
MNRRDYYYLQPLSESELDDGFEQAELADRAIMSDLAIYGVVAGLGVVEHTPQNISVDIGAGVAYDAFGQRIRVTSGLVLPLTTDYLGSSTAVVTPGNLKKVAIFIKADRVLSDPRIDGNTDTVYFERNETFTFRVVQGGESLSPTAPGPPDVYCVLLADVTRSYGQTEILAADIAVTRRQDVFAIAGVPASIRAGNPIGAISAMLGLLNNHVLGLANPHIWNSLQAFTDISVDTLKYNATTSNITGSGALATQNLSWNSMYRIFDCSTYTGVSSTLTLNFNAGTFRFGAEYRIAIKRTAYSNLQKLAISATGGILSRFDGSDQYLQPGNENADTWDFYVGRPLSATEIVWSAAARI